VKEPENREESENLGKHPKKSSEKALKSGKTSENQNNQIENECGQEN